MVQLSRTVYKILPTYHWRMRWMRWVQERPLLPPQIPLAYQKDGVTLIDAQAEQKQHDKIVEDYCEWEPDHPMFAEAPGDSPKNPRWKNEAIRRFDGTNQLLEGLEQMQIITKSIAIRGPPPIWKQLEPLVDQFRIADEDERVRRYIMQSVRWHAANDILLPRRNYRHGFGEPHHYGITIARASDLLSSNLLRLAEVSFSGSPDLLKRRVIKDALSKTKWQRGADRVIFDCNHDIMVTCEKPIAPFSSKNEVEQTKELELPSIYPVKFNISLDKVNVYDWENRHPLTDDCPAAAPHTIFLCNNHICFEDIDSWTMSQNHARALGHCFAALSAYAKRLYGEDVKDLPEPLTIQCVQMERGRKYGFYAFQLNTLDMDNLTGIKNQAWIDVNEHIEYNDDEMVRTDLPYVMYTLADQLPGLMGYQMYKERDQVPCYPVRSLNTYNPEVVKKVLALCANQLNLAPIAAGVKALPEKQRV